MQQYYPDYYYFVCSGECAYRKTSRVVIFADAGNGMKSLLASTNRAVNLFSLLNAFSRFSATGDTRVLVHLCTYNEKVHPVETGFVPCGYLKAALETRGSLLHCEGIPDLNCVFSYLNSTFPEGSEEVDAIIIYSRYFTSEASRRELEKCMRKSGILNAGRFAVGIVDFEELTDESKSVINRFTANGGKFLNCSDNDAINEILAAISARNK